MASSLLPRSLQRTDSTGQLNVFILLKRKSNGELMIVSREDLPPTLRSGRLLLNQKIIIRGEERSSIEGTIVYMHAQRDACVAFKKQLTESNPGHMDDSGSNVGSAAPQSPSTSRQHDRSTSVKATKPASTSATRSADRAPKPSPSTASSTKSNSKATENIEDQSHVDMTSGETLDSSSEFSFSPETNLKEKEKSHTSFEATFDVSGTAMNDQETDLLLEKITQLSLQISQLKQLVKQRDNELKRLRQVMIELPSDPGVRDYLCYLADKIRQNTCGYRYDGSLTQDAKSLGIAVASLAEILALKNPVTSIAREIFKKIVPDDQRSVQHWNELSEAVLLKEKLLIKFLERYFGPLEVDSKKVHISLVGCLRNDRGKQKKQRGQAPTVMNNEEIAHLSDFLVDDRDDE